jgi:hypothetical protein
MRLQIGSRWRDHLGQEFVVEHVDSNDAETWVTYTRTGDGTSYRCLAEAFLNRFQEKVQ